MSKKTILVTGSAGFIFSNFVRHLLYNNNEYRIVSIDKIATQNSLHNIYANKGHNFYIGDIIDKHFLDIVFQLEKPDIIVHGAAESHVDISIQGAIPFVKSNVLGTQTLIDVALKYNIKKFVYISTDEVYGQLSTTYDIPWTEMDPPNPRNPYSSSKLCGELLVKAAHTTHGLQYLITRSCNNIGPRQATRNLVPKIINNIINNEKVPIYGEGKQIREWIHVFDNCAAIAHIIKNAPVNNTYNISTGWELTNIDMFISICDTLGKGYDLAKFIPDPRPGHDFRYSINSSKLRSLSWEPNFTFKNALSQTCQWYVNNQWFLK